MFVLEKKGGRAGTGQPAAHVAHAAQRRDRRVRVARRGARVHELGVEHREGAALLCPPRVPRKRTRFANDSKDPKVRKNIPRRVARRVCGQASVFGIQCSSSG